MNKAVVERWMIRVRKWRTGELIEATIESSIDMEELIFRLGSQAINNKTQRTTTESKTIKVKVISSKIIHEPPTTEEAP